MKQEPLVSSTYPTRVARKTRTWDDVTKSRPSAYPTKVAKPDQTPQPRKTSVWDQLSVPIENAFKPLTLLKGENMIMAEKAPQRHPKNTRGSLPVKILPSSSGLQIVTRKNKLMKFRPRRQKYGQDFITKK